MDQKGSVKPSDVGYPELNWTIRSNNRTAAKLAVLNSQVTVDPREVAIRDRRQLEHTGNVGGLQFAGRMLERYTGSVHLHLHVTPGTSLVMQSFATIASFKFYVEFFDFDSDCQSGTVWGTLGV
jgi:hypothetical protein